MDFQKVGGLLYIRHFVCLGKSVDISYVNHFGAIMVYEFDKRCRLQKLSISTLSCWLVLLGMVEDR